MDFASKLKNLRRQAKISQKGLAAKLGISSSSLAMYETNKRTPDLDTVRLLADYFKVSIDELAGIPEKPEPGPTGSMSFLKIPKNIFSHSFGCTITSIPLLGSISPEIPLAEQSDVLGYLPLFPDLPRGDYIYIRNNGHSMHPTIPDQSIVLIRIENISLNGKICLVITNNICSIKRLYRYSNKIELISDNAAYDKIEYCGEDKSTLRVIGVAVKVISDI